MESAETPPEPRERALADIEASITEFFRAGRNWSREFARAFGSGLPAIAFGVLRYVRIHGPVRASDIAEAFDMDKGAVSRQLTLLRDRGLLEQRPDPEDRRAIQVEATAEAHAAFDELKQQIRDRYDAILADWTDAELESFAAQLARFTRSLP